MHERLLTFGSARLGELALVSLTRFGGHEEQTRGLVERRLLEHALRKHFSHVSLHVRNALGAPLRELFQAVRLAQADGVAVTIEGAGEADLSSACEHERTAEHSTCGDKRHGSRKLDKEHDKPYGDKRNSHGDARDHKRYAAAALGRGARIAQAHELLFALAFLNERVLLLTSADTVRCLRNPAADALSGGAGNTLDSRLEVAEIARLHGVLRSVCNLVGHVI